MSYKSELIGQIGEGWRSLRSVLDAVPEARMEEQGVVDAWSVKDVMGHITTWEEIGMERVQALMRDEEPVRRYADLDDFNKEDATRKGKLPLNTIREQLAQSHEKLMTFLEGLPEEYFESGSETAGVIKGESYSHYVEHGEDIRRWLDTNRP